MTYTDIFFTSAILTLWIVALYTTFRNFMVHNFLMDVLEVVKEKSEEDIRSGKDYEWRYEELKKVSYDDVLYSFKRLKVKNYWKDDKFIK
ncbi:MAG TPA: hypothetical protein VK255_03230 [Patescibacteria group bacterium]|nr:hypothetical protein [Patescibacteria group bacterium]